MQLCKVLVVAGQWNLPARVKCMFRIIRVAIKNSGIVIPSWHNSEAIR